MTNKKEHLSLNYESVGNRMITNALVPLIQIVFDKQYFYSVLHKFTGIYL